MTDTSTTTNTTDSFAAWLLTGQSTYTPAEAVRWITRDPLSGNTPNHVDRDVRTLRRAGITPEKIAGRWIVRAGELLRFAAATASSTPRHVASISPWQ